MALAEMGHDVRVVCPLYGSIKPDIKAGWRTLEKPHCVHLGGRELWCRVWETKLAGSKVTYYFLEHDGFFGRKGVYSGHDGDYHDNGQRFTYLSRAGLSLPYLLDWMPDIVHSHDWPTGLVPVYQNAHEMDSDLGKAATVHTVHNLQHQGHFNPSLMGWANLPGDLFRDDGLAHGNALNMMKGGLYHATKITTVSPTYAHEIQTPEYGCGLDPVLRHRAADLLGVLNGIDEAEWNPAKDKFIPATFTAKKLKGKARCKTALQAAFDLTEDDEKPVYGVVSRLWSQKGLDLLAEILPGILRDMQVQFVILGSGDPHLENRFKELSFEFRGQMGSFIGYNNVLSHLVYAGSDFFAMPSRFEPCGLSQLYSMKYGTVPIVRSTGGLVDTVEDFHIPEKGDATGTGLRFSSATPDAVYRAVGRACALWYDQPEAFSQIQQNAMAKTFDWDASAKAYERLYKEAVKARRG